MAEKKLIEVVWREEYRYSYYDLDLSLTKWQIKVKDKIFSEIKKGCPHFEWKTQEKLGFYLDELIKIYQKYGFLYLCVTRTFNEKHVSENIDPYYFYKEEKRNLEYMEKVKELNKKFKIESWELCTLKYFDWEKVKNEKDKLFLQVVRIAELKVRKEILRLKGVFDEIILELKQENKKFKKIEKYLENELDLLSSIADNLKDYYLSYDNEEKKENKKFEEEEEGEEVEVEEKEEEGEEELIVNYKKSSMFKKEVNEIFNPKEVQKRYRKILSFEEHILLFLKNKKSEILDGVLDLKKFFYLYFSGLKKNRVDFFNFLCLLNKVRNVKMDYYHSFNIYEASNQHTIIYWKKKDNEKKKVPNIWLKDVLSEGYSLQRPTEDSEMYVGMEESEYIRAPVLDTWTPKETYKELNKKYPFMGIFMTSNSKKLINKMFVLAELYSNGLDSMNSNFFSDYLYKMKNNEIENKDIFIPFDDFKLFVRVEDFIGYRLKWKLKKQSIGSGLDFFFLEYYRMLAYNEYVLNNKTISKLETNSFEPKPIHWMKINVWKMIKLSFLQKNYYDYFKSADLCIKRWVKGYFNFPEQNDRFFLYMRKNFLSGNVIYVSDVKSELNEYSTLDKSLLIKEINKINFYLHDNSSFKLDIVLSSFLEKTKLFLMKAPSSYVSRLFMTDYMIELNSMFPLTDHHEYYSWMDSSFKMNGFVDFFLKLGNYHNEEDYITLDNKVSDKHYFYFFVESYNNIEFKNKIFLKDFEFFFMYKNKNTLESSLENMFFSENLKFLKMARFLREGGKDLDKYMDVGTNMKRHLLKEFWQDAGKLFSNEEKANKELVSKFEDYNFILKDVNLNFCINKYAVENTDSILNIKMSYDIFSLKRYLYFSTFFFDMLNRYYFFEDRRKIEINKSILNKLSVFELQEQYARIDLMQNMRIDFEYDVLKIDPSLEKYKEILLVPQQFFDYKKQMLIKTMLNFFLKSIENSFYLKLGIFFSYKENRKSLSEIESFISDCIENEYSPLLRTSMTLYYFHLYRSSEMTKYVKWHLGRGEHMTVNTNYVENTVTKSLYDSNYKYKNKK